VCRCFQGSSRWDAVFGTVAAQKGLTFLETIMINSLVFAGASQFVAMEVYSEPLTWGSLIAMVGVTAAVNMRMLLIGASLRPWLGQVPGYKTYPSLFFPDRSQLADFSFGVREGHPGLGHLSR
jgi:predicted branched-subunit amino acid permease